MTLIDRDGVTVAALLHDPSLDDEPELLAAATAGAGIAVENARLHVELRARLEELRGSRARMVDVANKERQRLERNLHDGAQQRLVALSLELSLLGRRPGGRYGGPGAADPGAARDRGVARGTPRDRPRDPSRRGQRARARGRARAARCSGPGSSAAWRSRRMGGCRRRSRLRRTTSSAKASRTWASTPRRRRRRSTSSAPTAVVQIEVTDDGVGGVDTERGSGLRGIADRVEALDGRLRIWSPVGGGTRIRAEIPCAP